MEVSGKKILADASAVDATYCQPCSNDGETVPAEAYCTICEEFMCSNCTNVHKKQNISKYHALLDKSSMPRAVKGHLDVPLSTEPCDIHPEEFIKYFCPTHNTLSCGHCLAKEHRKCPVDIISEISICFQDCQEYGDIIKAISQLSKALEYCTEDIHTKLNLIKQLAKDEVSSLHKYREKIKTYFDERENALLKIIEEMKSIDETRLRSMKPKCDSLKVKMEEIKTKLAKHERNTTQLFIEVKKAKKQIQSLQSGLTDIKKDMTIHRYQMRKDPATEKLFSSSTGLGTVDEIQSSEKDSNDSEGYAVVGHAPKEKEPEMTTKGHHYTKNYAPQEKVPYLSTTEDNKSERYASEENAQTSKEHDQTTKGHQFRRNYTTQENVPYLSTTDDNKSVRYASEENTQTSKEPDQTTKGARPKTSRSKRPSSLDEPTSEMEREEDILERDLELFSPRQKPTPQDIEEARKEEMATIQRLIDKWRPGD